VFPLKQTHQPVPPGLDGKQPDSNAGNNRLKNNAAGPRVKVSVYRHHWETTPKQQMSKPINVTHYRNPPDNHSHNYSLNG
jgi:hypothetical protein